MSREESSRAENSIEKSTVEQRIVEKSRELQTRVESRRVEIHFSWQAQHFVKFWEIAGAPNVVFFHTKCASKTGRVRSPKRRVRDDDFMVGLSSNRLYLGGRTSRSFL